MIYDEDVCDLEFFNKNGFAFLRKAISEEKIDSYIDLWNYENKNNPAGWSNIGGSAAAFLDYKEITDILCDKSIALALDKVQKSVALHADVTYSVTTELDWHQDNCMPNDIAGDNYIGVWVALEDIDPEAGPFEFISGSHKWDLDYEHLYEMAVAAREDPYFNVKRMEYYQSEIDKRSVEIERLIIKKGDVFIWHGRLLHRGSPAKDRTKTRMSLIGHYCNNYANLYQESCPSFSFQKKEMMESSDRYAAWEGSGAFYFVNP